MLFLTSRFFFIHSCEILVIAGDNLQEITSFFILQKSNVCTIIWKREQMFDKKAHEIRRCLSGETGIWITQ